MKSTIVAVLLALAIPCAVKAETVDVEGYQNYQVSCSEESACNNFDVTYEEVNGDIAQTRRTRSRRSRSGRSKDIQAFKNFYTGFSLGLYFGEDLDLGFQGGIFGGTKFNEYIGADVEFTFAFADLEDIDENATILGFYLNPRFEYAFDNTKLTAFVSPGIGLASIDVSDNSDTEFAFQIKAGGTYDLQDNLELFAQGRYQNIDDFDAFAVETGLILNL